MKEPLKWVEFLEGSRDGLRLRYSESLRPATEDKTLSLQLDEGGPFEGSYYTYSHVGGDTAYFRVLRKQRTEGTSQ